MDLIIRNQEIIKATQREHGQLLDIVLKNSSPPEPEIKDALRQFGFKLKTFSDMTKLESILENDVERRTLISYFSGIGGSQSNVVGRILSRAMTNELASQYCYKRQNEEKRAFQNLALCSAVIESVRCQKKLSLTEDAIESKIKNWLRHARARKDGSSNEDE
ncbi:hypothetical protein OUZ56_003685 [Daphnia magna]|uniref:DUF4806 domain-containing protein n=2 Tax=Daphnia magna TaxID=35525 RepID=A0ABR0A9G6_9CRUS|nr:hypothetical protein OUZ56_003685 [Daphnia magna]